METYTRESIAREKFMDRESMFGPQESTMKANGRWAIRMAMASGKASQVTPTLANGATISHMASESIAGVTEMSMRGSGRRV